MVSREFKVGLVFIVKAGAYALLVLGTYLVCDPVFNLSAIVANTLQLKKNFKKGVKYSAIN